MSWRPAKPIAHWLPQRHKTLGPGLGAFPADAERVGEREHGAPRVRPQLGVARCVAGALAKPKSSF